MITAKADFWKFKEFLRREINLKLKLRIFKIYIFSVVGYGSEAWTFSSTVKEKINAMEMWCYRRILKVSWKEMISDEKVLDMIGKKSLLQDLIQRKMRSAGQIMRGSSRLLPRLVLEGMIEGKRERKTEKNLGR